MSLSSALTHSVNDLTQKDPATWKSWEEQIAPKYEDNQAQFNIVKSLKQISNKLNVVIGHPGTGKPTVLADLANGSCHVRS